MKLFILLLYCLFISQLIPYFIYQFKIENNHSIIFLRIKDLPSNNRNCPIVISTTIGVFNEAKFVRFANWYLHLQTKYNFCYIIYTNSSEVIYNNNNRMKIVRKYQVNQFSMPVISYILLNSKKQFKSNFYAYVNSDIFLSEKLSLILDYIMYLIRIRRLPKMIELAGRVSVYELKEIPLYINSVDTLRMKKMRSTFSAVIIIEVIYNIGLLHLFLSCVIAFVKK